MPRIDPKRVRGVVKAAVAIGAAAGKAPSRLLVVGAGEPAAGLGAALSRGAADIAGGWSAGIDVLEAGAAGAVHGTWAAAVFVAQGKTPAAAAGKLAADLREAGVAVMVAVPVAADGQSPVPADWPARAGFRRGEIVRDRPGGAGLEELVARRLAERLGENGLALAARLPVVRAAVVRRIIDKAARQNGAVGAVVFVPGADMPVMTLNQVRMVLRIAAAYGEEVGSQRALEILSVVGAGFGFRALARQALDVVPVAGWALKGALGYTATLSLGKASLAYFDAGAPLAPARAKKISEKIDDFTRGPLGKRLISTG